MHRTASPDNSDAGIEQELKSLGKTAPCITADDIRANIVSEHYFTAAEGLLGAGMAGLENGEGAVDLGEAMDEAGGPLDLLTICVLVLRNGFTVVGTSACASPENFDAEVGRKLAKAKAFDQVWQLMGYELRSRLASGQWLVDLGQLSEGDIAHLMAAEPGALVQVMPKEPAAEATSILQPHQQRVVAELEARAGELERLDAFIASDKFKTVDAAEQARLRAQSTVMTSLTNILRERIAVFLANKPPKE